MATICQSCGTHQNGQESYFRMVTGLKSAPNMKVGGVFLTGMELKKLAQGVSFL